MARSQLANKLDFTFFDALILILVYCNTKSVVNFESYGSVKFRFVKKVTTRHFFFQNSSMSQIHKKDIISPTGLILSFSDWGYFISKFDILKSTVNRKLVGLSNLETWYQSDPTSKTIMF